MTASNACSTGDTTFSDRLHQRAVTANTLLCVGLDPARGRMPAGIPETAAGAVRFCDEIIAATADLALAFKPNLAFFLAWGAEGLDALYTVRGMVPPDVPVMLDCKTGDIGSTAAAYATAWFDELGVDAITVNPWLGEDSLEPYLTRPGKGVFVLAKTSNSGSGDFQDQRLQSTGRPLFTHAAARAAQWEIDYPASVGLVAGATWPDQLRQIRQLAPDLPILLPGLGTQGGDLRAALTAGLQPDGTGVLCSSSRGIIYASSGNDFGAAARTAAATLRDEINVVRHTTG